MAERRDRDKLTPREIAEKDRREYEDPERDLMATKPTDPGSGGGGAGDVDNPEAQTDHVPGSIGKTEGQLGSDEENRLADGRNA